MTIVIVIKHTLTLISQKMGFCSLGSLVIFLSKSRDPGAGGIAQWLGALKALPEGPGSIPSAHMAARNRL